MATIRELRMRAGITQAELTRRIQPVDAPRLSRWETGCARPGRDNAVTLAKALGGTLEEVAPWLFAGKGGAK